MQTCLVIDESSVVRKVANRILSKHGVTVAEAASGAEGLATIALEAPRVLVVSAALTDMPAEDVIRKIRAMPGGGEITILPLLVEAHLGQMTRLKRAGATGFIFKPFDRASLIGWLAPHLGMMQAA